MPTAATAPTAFADSVPSAPPAPLQSAAAAPVAVALAPPAALQLAAPASVAVPLAPPAALQLAPPAPLRAAGVAAVAQCSQPEGALDARSLIIKLQARNTGRLCPAYCLPMLGLRVAFNANLQRSCSPRPALVPVASHASALHVACGVDFTYYGPGPGHAVD